MDTKLLKGKVVKRVRQSRWRANSGPACHIDSIEFTDGSELRFHVLEGETEYGIEPIYVAGVVPSPTPDRWTAEELEAAKARGHKRWLEESGVVAPTEEQK